jgi:hypothetical protein
LHPALFLGGFAVLNEQWIHVSMLLTRHDHEHILPWALNNWWFKFASLLPFLYSTLEEVENDLVTGEPESYFSSDST